MLARGFGTLFPAAAAFALEGVCRSPEPDWPYFAAAIRSRPVFCSTVFQGLRIFAGYYALASAGYDVPVWRQPRTDATRALKLPNVKQRTEERMGDSILDGISR